MSAFSQTTNICRKATVLWDQQQQAETSSKHVRETFGSDLVVAAAKEHPVISHSIAQKADHSLMVSRSVFKRAENECLAFSSWWQLVIFHFILGDVLRGCWKVGEVSHIIDGNLMLIWMPAIFFPVKLPTNLIVLFKYPLLVLYVYEVH